MDANERCSPLIADFEAVLDLSAAEEDCLRRLEAPSRRLSPRADLIVEGQKVQDIYIVKDGWLIEYKSLPDGGRQILTFRLPGELTGADAAAFEVVPHSVAALTHSTIAPVPLQDFIDVQRRFPRIGAALLIRTLRHDAILHQWEVSLGRRSAYNRLGHLLLELHRRLERRHLVKDFSNDCSFDFPGTQQDLADALGLSNIHVSRTLRRMQREGLIERDRRRIAIKDVARLADLSSFDPSYLSMSGKEHLLDQDQTTPKQHAKKATEL